jgi:hypothetical protein
MKPSKYVQYSSGFISAAFAIPAKTLSFAKASKNRLPRRLRLLAMIKEEGKLEIPRPGFPS